MLFERNTGERPGPFFRLGRVVSGITCVLLLLGLGGCGSAPLLMKKPDVKKVSVTLAGLDFHKIDLRFDVEVENVSSSSLAVAGYDYDLAVEGQSCLKGTSDIGFELKPRAVTIIPVPISIKLADLFRQIGSLLGRSDAAYSITVGFLIKTPVGAFRLPFQKEGRVPLFPSKIS